MNNVINSTQEQVNLLDTFDSNLRDEVNLIIY
jgi:hypothetical protein